MALDNVQLLYQHPHITLYLEDNTIQNEESDVESDSGFYGIQVGPFESGRDNVVLRYTSTAQMISELGSPNYELYGQAGYNAYNALSSGACGMYIMRVMPDNAAFANAVIMAKFKLIKQYENGDIAVNTYALSYDETMAILNNSGDNVDTSVELVSGKNVVTDMRSFALGTFSLYGSVVSGVTGIDEIDDLFPHISNEWAEENGLPAFTIITVRVSVPAGLEPGEKIKITQTSNALKSFYADFGEDPENIVASSYTATKTKEYNSTDLLDESGEFFDIAMLIEENDMISLSIEWNDEDTTNTDYTFSAANLIFDEETDDEELGQYYLEISYYKEYFEGVTTEEELQLKFAALYNENLDEAGYYHMPLAMIYALGRGVYGNNLRVKFTDAMEYDYDDPDYRRYCATVMQLTKDGLVAKEYIRGSISEIAWDSVDASDGFSAYLQDLANDREYGSQKVHIEFCEQTLEKMVELYNEKIADPEQEIPEVTTTDLDPIFGLDMVGEANPFIIRANYDDDDKEPVNLEAVDGFELVGGDDGDFTYKPKATAEEQAEYQKALNKALIRAFEPINTGNVVNGKEVILPVHDRMLRSRYCTPADFMFDANFDNEVKIAMVNFAKKREYDCMTYLDTGLCTTTTECISELKAMSGYFHYNVVKDMHCYRWRDSKFTRKVVPMTITHWLSYNLPRHLYTYGIGEAFARKYARLHSGTDFVAGSFLPVIDPDDNDIKKQIQTYRANCYEALDRRTFQRASAITTCQEKSDRAEEFNEYILHAAVRIAYAIMNDDIYAKLTDEKILDYTEHAEKEISYVLAGLVRKVKISMESSQADRKKSVLRLKMHIEFYSVAKYGAIEIYLDPRGTADAEEAELAARFYA